MKVKFSQYTTTSTLKDQRMQIPQYNSTRQKNHLHIYNNIFKTPIERKDNTNEEVRTYVRILSGHYLNTRLYDAYAYYIYTYIYVLLQIHNAVLSILYLSQAVQHPNWESRVPMYVCILDPSMLACADNEQRETRKILRMGAVQRTAGMVSPPLLELVWMRSCPTVKIRF